MASTGYFVVLVISILHNSKGDINIHNPRGSNNRLNEENRPRDNANRLFNSQNNNRGGHNVGVEPLYYYSGSKLEIQWAVQHSCGDQNNNCEIIMQYMCGENVRDGSTTNTPPLNQRACRNGDCNTDHRFGMHEDFHYFEKCQLKERNMGLFTATQDVRRSARSTRQNNNGDRYGYECAEERDYYPYWGPSPWKDIVVFTNNPDRCPYYQQESQNVQAKYECIFDDEVYAQYRRRDRVRLYLNQQDCEWSTVTIGKETYTGRWVRRPSHRLPPPDCRPSPWSRDNHQGNTIGGEFMKYDWTIPELNDDDQNCVIRMRYNISTNDYDAWETDATYNEKQPDTIWKQFGMMDRDAKKRQYVFRNNPKVDVFGIHNRTKAFRLQVALNTAQYGRTFQDRTHVFRVLRRPKAFKKKVIHNVNVRGKRGNIVQVYPSTEYDFVPNKLRVTGGEMVHFQWTGSDKNPRNNDGNGAIQTDRSNIVQLAQRTFKKGRWPVKHNNTYFATNYPSHSEDFLGLGWKKTDELAFLERCAGSDPLLDKKSAYFDLGPQTLENTGTFHYMSTRNNDFSKRSQKAVIYVADGQFLAADKGASYRGFQSVTSSGRVCQRWDRQTPHRHPFNPRRNRRYNVEENFCRNPNKRYRPWCYTTDPDVEWEYCDIAIEADNIGRTRRTLGDENNVFPKTDQDETGVQVQDEL